MSIYRVSDIHLTGEDAANFLRRLLFPSKEEIRQHEEYLDKLNEEIEIQENERGFSADVKGLDLSFVE